MNQLVNKSINACARKAIFLMGPTASGKTNLVMQLAEKYPIDIISVDSAMIYRGMNIGTGKPSLVELKKFPHHLVDIRQVDQPYSAADFIADVLPLMEQAVAASRVPVLVGGTMLYFNALCNGLADLPSANQEVRDRIEQQAIKQGGWPNMHRVLVDLDPSAAKMIKPNDQQRLQRAFEVIEITGKSFSSFLKPVESPIKDWHIEYLVLSPIKREILHQRIEQRFNEMLKLGLIDEVEQLYTRYTSLPSSLRAVGYRQIISYLQGESNLAEMKDKAIAATRQLAKRQYTWLNKWENLQWMDSLNLDAALQQLTSIINFFYK